MFCSFQVNVTNGSIDHLGHASTNGSIGHLGHEFRWLKVKGQHRYANAYERYYFCQDGFIFYLLLLILCYIMFLWVASSHKDSKDECLSGFMGSATNSFMVIACVTCAGSELPSIRAGTRCWSATEWTASQNLIAISPFPPSHPLYCIQYFTNNFRGVKDVLLLPLPLIAPSGPPPTHSIVFIIRYIYTVTNKNLYQGVKDALWLPLPFVS